MMILNNKMRLKTLLGLAITFLSPLSFSEELQTHKVFKGEVFNAWKHFTQYNPQQKQLSKPEKVYPKDFRGGVKDGFLLQPYWMEDLSRDRDFRRELRFYGKLIKALNNGNLSQALSGINQFLVQHSASLLKPNALFAKAICLAGLRQNRASKQILKLFVKEYPNHPLVKDALVLLKEL